MKTTLDFKWSVSWQYVDKTEMFNAVRGNEKWRDAVINSMQRIDDHDPDNISCGVEVETLAELRDLLNATASVTTPWGYALCLHAKNDAQRLSCHAALATGDQFTSSCTLYQMPPKKGENPLHDKLAEIHRELGHAMDMADGGNER